MAICDFIGKNEYPFINHIDEEQFVRRQDESCVKINTKDFLKRANEAMEIKIKKVKKDLSRKLGPGWYQELSENQIAAANLVFSAIRDDDIKCQLKRVKHVLTAIGVHPLPKQFQLVAALKFSKNNDLAFLWFLYESVYRTCDDICSQKIYSLNERLLLSSICHLDMVTTLRELDRILPKPEIKVKKIEAKRKSREINKSTSPYLTPLPKPVIPEKRIFKGVPRKQPNFELYDLYKDENYIVESEGTRWFSIDYLIPSKARCIAENIIKNLDFDKGQVLESICDKHRQERKKTHDFLKNFLNENQLSHIDEMKHLSMFEKGVVYGYQLELAKTEKEFKELAEKYQTQIIVRTLLRQIIDKATDLKFIHLCDMCKSCAESRELYEKISKCNIHEEENSSHDPSVVKYFYRPTPTTPYTFDYEKIFTTNFLDDNGAVKNSLNAALELDKYLTEDNAITVCLRDMWQLELKLWNEKHQMEIEERANNPMADVDCNKIVKDKKNVFKLLRKAICWMRKYPKFVLAALPYSYRLPLLREWALQRYGFEYTNKDESERFKLNKFQRDRVMRRLVPNVKVPTYQSFGITSMNIDHDVIAKKKKMRIKWEKSFYSKIAQGYMDKIRLLWVTMEPYLGNLETMRQTFYAYLPASERKVDKIVMDDFY